MTARIAPPDDNDDDDVDDAVLRVLKLSDSCHKQRGLITEDQDKKQGTESRQTR